MIRQFLIVTHADDLHGLTVQAAVRQRGFACHIVECDELGGREAINFSVGPDGVGPTMLRTSEGSLLNIAGIETIWWRRFKARQQVGDTPMADDRTSLIDNDCSGALVGSLQNGFCGKWISNPVDTEFASNKLNQLAAASHCGQRIPDTVVTQSPSVVRAFLERHEQHVIVKPVVGTRGPLLFTQMVRKEHLKSEDSIRACPAIYQECIPGTRHIRLNCFGDRSFAGLIESDDLDWRPNLDVPISRWPVPPSVHRDIRRVLDRLNLAMGIIDLKETPDGELVWLEVNPQGQFLFLEGLTGEPLTEHFADFLTTV